MLEKTSKLDWETRWDSSGADAGSSLCFSSRPDLRTGSESSLQLSGAACPVRNGLTVLIWGLYRV